jgi:hypothetical protein
MQSILEYIKHFAIAFLIGVALTAAGFIIYLTFFVKPAAVITETKFITNISPIQPMTGKESCDEIRTRFAQLYEKYQAYAYGKPTYISNYSVSCMDFTLAQSVYRICVDMPVPVETLKYDIGAGYALNGGLTITAGLSWAFLRASVTGLTGIGGSGSRDIMATVSYQGRF